MALLIILIFTLSLHSKHRALSPVGRESPILHFLTLVLLLVFLLSMLTMFLGVSLLLRLNMRINPRRLVECFTEFIYAIAHRSQFEKEGPVHGVFALSSQQFFLGDGDLVIFEESSDVLVLIYLENQVGVLQRFQIHLICLHFRFTSAELLLGI